MLSMCQLWCSSESCYIIHSRKCIERGQQQKKKKTYKGDGEQKKNSEGRGVDELTTMQTPRRKMERRKSDERMMVRGERMKDYLVSGAIFSSSSDKA